MARGESVIDGVQDHYSKSDLGGAILAALQRRGKDIDNLQLADLEAVDEFHVRGREATRELARRAGVDARSQVLDVGCGIGGAARTLAHEFGARVTGIDLTDEYCRAATMLTERVGLAERVTFRQASALDLPFPDASFDVVWTQHAAMNIPDKPRLYGECSRVLKPGGMLAIYDILAGPTSPVHFPVPWARAPETSFLVTPVELRALVEAAGLQRDALGGSNECGTRVVRTRRAKDAAGCPASARDPSPGRRRGLPGDGPQPGAQSRGGADRACRDRRDESACPRVVTK